VARPRGPAASLRPRQRLAASPAAADGIAVGRCVTSGRPIFWREHASWGLCLSAVSTAPLRRTAVARAAHDGVPSGRADRHACWQCGLVSSHVSFATHR